MPTAVDNEVATLYRSIVEEIMVRVHSIDGMIKAQGFPATLIREYCYLQFRMVCENIAIGCLLCHEDIDATKTKALQKAYDPNFIFSRLSELHPDFYPVPVIPQFSPGSIHLDDFKGKYLTKAELIALWGKAGDYLHKGNLRKMLKQKETKSLRVDDIVEWNQKILNLMQNHKISRLGNNFHFIVHIAYTLFTPTNIQFNLQVAIAESPKP